MPILRCYVSDDDLQELRAESERSGRKVEELAEAVIMDAIIKNHHRCPPREVYYDPALEPTP